MLLELMRVWKYRISELGGTLRLIPLGPDLDPFLFIV